MSSYSELIFEIREKSGLTQAQLAEKISCPRTVVSMIETGTRIPTRKQFYAIKEVFNIPDELLEETLSTEIIDQLENMTSYEMLKVLRGIE